MMMMAPTTGIPPAAPVTASPTAAGLATAPATTGPATARQPATAAAAAGAAAAARPPMTSTAPAPPRPGGGRRRAGAPAATAATPPPQSRSPWSAPPGSPAPPRLTDLTVPLATLLGPPTRPGESHGFGPLDPALCRALAALAAASPCTTCCVTVTDPDGHATGHGCLTAGRRRAPLPGAPDPPLTALPARLNLTITAARLTTLLPPAGQPRPPGQPPPAPTRLADRLGAGEKPRPRPARPARRPALVRHLDHHLAQRPAVPGPRRARPHPRLRPPPRITRLPAQRHAPPPGPDPRRRVHPADLLPPRQRLRLRARHPLRPGRPDVRLQRRGKKPRLVESAWGAVPGLLPGRFPRPLSEPAVRLSTQRALHDCCRQAVSAGVQGTGIVLWR